jgi:WD40 repeat protein
MRHIESLAAGLACAIVWVGPARAQTVFRVSVTSRGIEHDGAASSSIRMTTQPCLSADGRLVLFAEDAPRLTPLGETQWMHLHVHDRATNRTEALRSATTGRIVELDLETSLHESEPFLSEDGRWVVFESFQEDLVVGDSNGLCDVFRLDRSSGQVVLASRASNGSQANASVSEFAPPGPSVSADGNLVVFSSEATNLVPNDTNSTRDVFVRDVLLGTTERVDLTNAGTQTNGGGWSPSLSADGRFAQFTSYATDIAPITFPFANAYLRDRALGLTTLVSQSGGQSADGQITDARLSRDASTVVLTSNATNLGPIGNPGDLQVHAWIRASGAFELVSCSTLGIPGNGWSSSAVPSSDGRFVAFQSYASNLVAGDNNSTVDVFVRDRHLGTTRLASRAEFGGTPQLGAYQPMLSLDGSTVAFRALSYNVVAGDTNGSEDIFVQVQASTFPQPLNYCVAKLDSANCLPQVATVGVPSIAGPAAFLVSIGRARNQEPGALLLGTGALGLPFHGGELCVGGQRRLYRLPSTGGSTSGTDCSGFLSMRLDSAVYAQLGVGPGTTLRAQFWYRDSGSLPPNDYGLSDGVRFVTQP